jgi:hypothetical protein
VGVRHEAIGKPCAGSRPVGGLTFKVQSSTAVAGSRFNVQKFKASRSKTVSIVPALRYGPLAYSGPTEFSNSVSIVPIESDDDSPLVNNPRNDSPECIWPVED